jgi:tRNA pseudouridine38-40 synthase
VAREGLSVSGSRRIKITVEFDGGAFQGWQVQGAGRPSVEAALARALGGALGHEVKLTGAGRTDSGVHALGMTAHFDTTTPIPVEKLSGAAAGMLPASVAIVRAEEAAGDFDARRDAVLRWYRYQIQVGGPPHPLGPRCWRVREALDVEAMEAGLAILGGDHDFRGFRASQCTAKRTQLTMEEASLTRAAGTAGSGHRAEGELLAIDFKCRSFLMRMVRLMVGAVVAAGRGRLGAGDIRRILESGERPHTVRSAPAEGLCLMAVAYTEDERRSVLTRHPPPPSF